MRFRRIRLAGVGQFETVCQQVFDWLENHPILSSTIEYLDKVPGDHHREINLLLDSSKIPNRLNASRYFVILQGKDIRQEYELEFKGYTPKTYEEHASACLKVLRAAIQQPTLDFYRVLAVYVTQEDYDVYANRGIKGQAEAFEVIRDVVTRDLYEFLDERLDEINAVNGLLRKYKQYAEWFQSSQLRQMATEHENQRGERALALHLQQYVFDQGVEFSVEPSSVSGEVDLLLRDPSGEYILIDAKYIPLGSSKSKVLRKIAEGFNQVARYCNDYNEPQGFLAVFFQ